MPKILAVDDSASLREMVRFTLTEEGYYVLEAEDGVQALELAKENLFDAVIADVHMPRMDGLTLVKELRALTGYRFVPILMLTTDSNTDMKQQAAASGATGWLVKPFSPDRLLQTIKRVLT